MFHSLNATLSAILDDQRAMPPSLAELLAARPSFRVPDKAFKDSQEAQDAAGVINLFLHEVQENRVLRDPVPVIRKQGDTYFKQRAPLRIDCSYIVTAWKEPESEVNANLTHQLLGQALLWLSRFTTIPGDYLQGDLRRNADDPNPTHQPFPLPTMIAQIDASKNTGEFWSALGIPPRPYFTLTVTIAMDLVQAIDGPLVTTRLGDVKAATKEIGADDDPAKPEMLLHIGGRVVDQLGEGVADATVEILDPADNDKPVIGLRGATRPHGAIKSDGRFKIDWRFNMLDESKGKFKLRAVAVGFDAGILDGVVVPWQIVKDSQGKDVVVPRPPEDYVIRLRPN